MSDIPVRKGRSNAILTYETVEEINLGIASVSNKLDFVTEKLENINRVHSDHEVRLRALELSQARLQGSSGTATWVWQAVWPAIGFAWLIFTYLSNKIT